MGRAVPEQRFTDSHAPARALRIRQLGDTDPVLATVARWLHEEWGHLQPDASPALTRERLAERCGRGVVPSLYLASVGDCPLGTVSLVGLDMPLRPLLSPWLASLWVLPAWRCRGVGARLLAHAENRAAAVGLSPLYLFTEDRQPWYARRGWQPWERLLYRGLRVTVMRKHPGDSLD